MLRMVVEPSRLAGRNKISGEADASGPLIPNTPLLMTTPRPAKVIPVAPGSHLTLFAGKKLKGDKVAKRIARITIPQRIPRRCFWKEVGNC